MRSIFSRVGHGKRGQAPVVPTKEVWVPGWGFKFPRADMDNLPQAGATSWAGTNGARSDISGNPNLSMLQIELIPGVMNPSPGVYNFDYVDEILADLEVINTAQGRNVGLWLMFPQREFTKDVNVSCILPPYMQVPLGNYSDPSTGLVHMRYKSALGVKPSTVNPGSGNFGYVVQYNDQDLKAWHEIWFAEVARRYDNHPLVRMITTSELSYGFLAINFSANYTPGALNPESLLSYRAGRWEMMRRLKFHFKKTPVSQDLNIPKPSANEWFNNNMPVTEKIIITASNSHWESTVSDGPSDPGGVGAISYWQGYTGTVAKCAQWQGDDMRSINPNTGVLHTLNEFYNRVTSATFGSSFVIIQRKVNEPDGRSWSQYRDYIAAFSSPTQGLVTARPSTLL